MPIIPPDIELVKQQFQQFTGVTELATGGFKVVYRCETSGRIEALKLIEIPNDPEVEDIEAFRNEIFGRTRREIEALEKCAIPELVRLGVLHPVRVAIGDREFVAYSEEFLDGQNLSQLIRANRAVSTLPGEPELKMLLRAGLRETLNKGRFPIFCFFSREKRQRGQKIGAGGLGLQAGAV